MVQRVQEIDDVDRKQKLREMVRESEVLNSKRNQQLLRTPGRQPQCLEERGETELLTMESNTGNAIPKKLLAH